MISITAHSRQNRQRGTSSGNCIVLDHGYGLQTIYGHLSKIAVHEGDLVKRGQIMGKSGQTGMAGATTFTSACNSKAFRLILRNGGMATGSRIMSQNA